ncbi:adhesion G-protein coupled receptor G2-like isoform X2 [Xenia sp. Carnegie-2017]|uniref:adhesion G-protein coupled receptor G2-like isoform X2 n=1 Tax=Xenia sp. Carnegie-2017 TaxID=2897299 RepID=UPI001F04D9B5|nr:adhesion G-protein coupled receptor G2-like isoform X2 [Xenia sp. Carnegie-2017]
MRNNIALNLSVRIPPDTTASLSIPKSLFEESTISNNNMNNRTAIFAFYKETKFFTTSIFQERSLFGRLNSLVIAGSIKGLTIRNLETPVEIALKEIEPGNTTSAKCSFWDFKLSNWSQEGCSFIRTLEDGRILCSCDHLTSFAMLMHIYPEKTHDLALSIVSYIGCALSLIRSILTIILVLMFRKLPNRERNHIVVNFCIALTLTLIVFLAAVERSKTASFVACRVAAIALHYFLLAALFWMAVDAFVKVFPISNPSSFMKGCYIFAWGCPLAIVIITVATSLDQYGDNTFCRLKGVPFIIGFFTLTVIIIFFHLVAFLCIIRSLCNGSDVTSDQKTSDQKTSDQKTSDKNLRSKPPIKKPPIKKPPIKKPPIKKPPLFKLSLTWYFLFSHGFLEFLLQVMQSVCFNISLPYLIPCKHSLGFYFYTKTYKGKGKS